MPRSKPRGRAQRASAALRDATAVPLASVEAPAWEPNDSYGRPSRSSIPSVCP